MVGQHFREFTKSKVRGEFEIGESSREKKERGQGKRIEKAYRDPIYGIVMT